MAPKYEVFISHAGEDKAPLAVLIYEGLKRRGISAFLDERELRVAGDAVQDMDEATRTALVGLFILSPEFALKFYPMLELECFLRRAGLLLDGGVGHIPDFPELIPVFYRLTVAGCKYVEAFEDMECDPVVKDRFNERVTKKETSMGKVLQLLTLLARRTGVENKKQIGNDDNSEMEGRRKELAEKICDEVTRVLIAKARKSEMDNEGSSRTERISNEGLHATFDAPKNAREVLLDFSLAAEDENAQTYEAKVLREVLQRDTGGNVISLFGGGGVGKSCIIRELARQKDVIERFPGGIYFISLGMDSSTDTFRSELLRILQISGGKQVAERRRDEKNTHVILGEVGKLLGRGRSLVLLDDVWERNGLKAHIVSDLADVLSNEHGGTVVVTTRSASVASRADVTINIEPREAVSETTKKILLKYAKFSLEEIEEEGLGWVIEKLQRLSGGIPVCLAIIGRGVGKLEVQLQGKRGRAWVMYWEKIRSNADTLLRGDVDNYKGLKASLPVALRVLEENEDIAEEEGWAYSWSAMYRSLCVMKKQTVLPVSVLKKIWKMGRTSEVLMVMEGFSSVGLGEIVCEGYDIKGLKVHDLLHDFAVSLARDGEGIREWHKRILDNYICKGNEKGTREWWSLENDGYVFENVCRHLRDSGSGGELLYLLLRVEWTNIRLEFGGLPRWQEDFAYCLDGIDDGGENDHLSEKREGLCQVRDAVAESWTLLSPNKREELGFQIYLRLQEVDMWPVLKYLRSVQEWQRGFWLKPDSDSCLRPRSGFSGEIPFGEDFRPLAVAVYGDPQSAVVGTEEGDLIIVNLEEKRVVRKLVGHKCPVEQVAVSTARRKLFSRSNDGTVIRWDMETGAEIGRTMLKGRSKYVGQYSSRMKGVNRVVFTRDCRILVDGVEDDEVSIWDVETGKRVGEAICGFEGSVGCIGVSSDGGRVAVGVDHSDIFLEMWELYTDMSSSMRSRRLWKVPRSCMDSMTCIAFSPDGKYLVSGGVRDDLEHFPEDTVECLQLWKANTGEPIGKSLNYHQSFVSCVTFTPDSKRVVSCGSYDNTVQLSNVESREEVGRKFRGHSFGVEAVAVCSNGQFAVSVGRENMQVWDLRNVPSSSNSDYKRPTESFYFRYLAASWDGRLYVSVHSHLESNLGCFLYIWDATSGKMIGKPMYTGDREVTCVAFSKEGGILVCGTNEGWMEIWDVDSRLNTAEFGSNVAYSVAFSPDEQLIVSGSNDGIARVWITGYEGEDLLLRARGFVPLSVRDVAKRAAEVSDRRRSKLGAASDEDSEAIDSEGDDSEGESSDGDGSGEETIDGDDIEITCVTFRTSGSVVCGLRSGEMYGWDGMKRWGPLNPSHDGAVTKIEALSEDLFRSLDCKGRELRWRVDKRRGLINVPNERMVELAETYEEKGVAELPRNGDIVCIDRFVRLGAEGPILATLPTHVVLNGWHYNASLGVVVTGLEDGQLLFSRFVR